MPRDLNSDQRLEFTLRLNGCDQRDCCIESCLHHEMSLGRECAFLYAFDLLELNGADLRKEPIEVRKSTLASLYARPGTACA
jgi:hypothetical protein